MFPQAPLPLVTRLKLELKVLLEFMNTGIVVIGRNEGKRLERCLQTVLTQVGKVVYVDSGSTDNSVAYAKSLGIKVVQLDMSTPFSAARARNEGFAALIRNYENLQFVQFIDGDCELCEGWIDLALSFLRENEIIVAVAGRRKEKFPAHSIYNTLCDVEWDTPVGEAKACGGDFLVRTASFQQVGGFNPFLIAGEEPELCYRFRLNGWKIYRLDQLMTLHDAAIDRFSQWWKRAVRSGYAYALGCALHGMGREHFRVRECLRIWLWGTLVPGVAVMGVALFSSWFFLFLLLYPLQAVRVFRRTRQRIPEFNIALMYAVLVVIDKWPQMWGQLLFLRNKLAMQASAIIEYK